MHWNIKHQVQPSGRMFFRKTLLYCIGRTLRAMAWSGVLLVMIIFLRLAAEKWPVLDDLVGLLGILFLYASASFCFVAFSYFKVFLIWLLLAVFVLFDATTRYKYNLFTKRVESILSCLEDNSVTGCLNPWCTRCPLYEPSTLKATQRHSWFFLHGCGNTNIFFFGSLIYTG